MKEYERIRSDKKVTEKIRKFKGKKGHGKIKKDKKE